MTAIKFTNLRVAGLLIYEVTGQRDDYIDLHNPQDVPEAEIAARNIFVDGAVSLTRLSGTAGASPIIRREAGDCTLDPQPYSCMRAGTIRMRVVTDTFMYYCMSHPSRRRLTGVTLRPAGGHAFTVPAGHFLFLARGSITAIRDGEAIAIEAPQLLDLGAEETFTAVTDALLAQIQKDEP